MCVTPISIVFQTFQIPQIQIEFKSNPNQIPRKDITLSELNNDRIDQLIQQKQYTVEFSTGEIRQELEARRVNIFS